MARDIGEFLRCLALKDGEEISQVFHFIAHRIAMGLLLGVPAQLGVGRMRGAVNRLQRTDRDLRVTAHGLRLTVYGSR